MLPATNPAMVILLVALTVAVWALWRIVRARRLKAQFEAQLEQAIRDRVLAAASSRSGEAAARLASIDLQPIPAAERQRFAAAWRSALARFVGDPPGAVEAADRLVTEMLSAEGYSMAEFQKRAEDLYATAQLYRQAHEIVMRRDRAETKTDELRTAMLFYRSLFEELTTAPPADAEKPVRVIEIREPEKSGVRERREQREGEREGEREPVPTRG